MPTSKKRVKKPKQEVEVAVKNPLHTKTGKIVVVVLAIGFVLTVLVSLVLAFNGYLAR
jgi:hypothetical protein